MKLKTGPPALILIVLGVAGGIHAIVWHAGISWPGAVLMWVIIILLSWGIWVRSNRP